MNGDIKPIAPHWLVEALCGSLEVEMDGAESIMSDQIAKEIQQANKLHNFRDLSKHSRNEFLNFLYIKKPCASRKAEYFAQTNLSSQLSLATKRRTIHSGLPVYDGKSSAALPDR
jgi:hypothetical protein